MKIVKLDATDSTNSYLKNLIKEKNVENWTVVSAEHQTRGRGQFKNRWESERGKNLTFSALVNFSNLQVAQQFYLNCAVSLALYNVLKYYIPEKLTVKWPNDILSANHKICGILIETAIHNAKVNYAIIGIGLNINQTVFEPNNANATSLKTILGKAVAKEELLEKILMELQYQMLFIDQAKFEEIKKLYESVLYKKGVPSVFLDKNDKPFLAKIEGIANSGKLLVELENEALKEFDLKEIKYT